MSCLKLPSKVINQIDRYRMHALWHDSDINKRGGYLVAWRNVCWLKEQGGHGVLNLRAQIKALLMKHLHKFLNKEDIPWVNLTWNAYYQNPLAPLSNRVLGSFWWTDLLHMLDEFKDFSSCVVFNGKTCLFWKDVWNFGYLLLNWAHNFFPL